MPTSGLSRARCFNTQPPEGGWGRRARFLPKAESFNTQPPEGGWGCEGVAVEAALLVSTHSRLKAAGDSSIGSQSGASGFNTQPPEGGWGFKAHVNYNTQVSTHSRLKAAGTFVNSDSI